jgi:hypothetical protein
MHEFFFDLNINFYIYIYIYIYIVSTLLIGSSSPPQSTQIISISLFRSGKTESDGPEKGSATVR